MTISGTYFLGIDSAISDYSQSINSTLSYLKQTVGIYLNTLPEKPRNVPSEQVTKTAKDPGNQA